MSRTTRSTHAAAASAASAAATPPAGARILLSRFLDAETAEAARCDGECGCVVDVPTLMRCGQSAAHARTAEQCSGDAHSISAHSDDASMHITGIV
jgi:hypothetical protein